MITLEQVKIIREKKYFTNNPGDKKPKGILRNIGDYIRKTGADPMVGDYGSETKIFAKGDKTKPLYRGGETSQGKQTTQNIKKGSIPEPKKLPKKPTILPPAGSDTEAVQKNLLTGKDDYSKIKSRRGRKPGSVNKPKVNKTPGQLDLFNQPKSTPKTGVDQAKISKKAAEFTAKVNKRRLERGSKTAERIKGATGGKTTGSLTKGNLSFPGDRSGAYKATKTDLETKKLFKKAGASGDVSPTAGSDIRKRVETIRKTRADKLGTPDPFDADYSKKVQKVDRRTKTSKAFDVPTTSDIKKGKIPKGYTAPKGNFPSGKPGTQLKDVVKNFQPRDRSASQYSSKVEAGLKKSQKSFRTFSRDLEDFRDRDVPGGPKGNTTTSRTSSTSSGSRYDPDIGMAPEDDFSRKKSFKQFNQQSKEAKKQFKAIKKAKKLDKKVQRTLLKKREEIRSMPGGELGRKNTKELRKINKDIRSIEQQKKAYKLASKGVGNPNAPVVYNKQYADLQQRLAKSGANNNIPKTKPPKTKTPKTKTPKTKIPKTKVTFSNRTQQYVSKPTFKQKLFKRLIPKGRGGKLGLGLTALATAYGTYKFLTRPKSTLQTKTTPIKLNKNTKNISPTSVQFNPKNDPLKLTKISKNTISFKDLSQFGKGKAYSVPGGIKSGIYTSNELKNVQRRIKQNKKEIDSNTGFYKGDPYGMLDVKTNKKSQRFIDAVKMNKNKN